MHSDAAPAALIAASLMGLPVVVVGVPRFAAPIHQLLFVLFGLLSLVPGCLLVHIVHVVCKDLAQSTDCVLIDQLVVLIQGLLPFFLLGVVEGFGPLPGSKGRVPLPLSKLWLIGWCIWCPGVLADVKYRDSLEVLGWYFSKDVHVRASVLRVVPCLPNNGELHNDLDLISSLVGKGHKSCQECSDFGLAALGGSSERTQAL